MTLTPRTWADLRSAIAKEAPFTTDLVAAAPSHETGIASTSSTSDSTPDTTKTTFMLMWDGESQRPRPLLSLPDPVAERWRTLDPEATLGHVEFVRVLHPRPLVHDHKTGKAVLPGPATVTGFAAGIRNFALAAIGKPKAAHGGGVDGASPSTPGTTTVDDAAASARPEGDAQKAAQVNGKAVATATPPEPVATVTDDPETKAALEAAQLRAAVLLHSALVGVLPAQNPLGPHDTGKGVCVLVELPRWAVPGFDSATTGSGKEDAAQEEEEMSGGLKGWARIVGMRNTLSLDWRRVEVALAHAAWEPAVAEAAVLETMEETAKVVEARLGKARVEVDGEESTDDGEVTPSVNEDNGKQTEAGGEMLEDDGVVVDAASKGKMKEPEPAALADPDEDVEADSKAGEEEKTVRFHLVFGLWKWEDDDSFA